MEKPDFLNEESLYYVEHNGIPSAGYVLVGDPDVLTIKDRYGVWTVNSEYEASEGDDSVTYHDKKADSTFYLAPLTLPDAPNIYPENIRTFPTLQHLETTIRRELSMVDSYTPDTGVAETLSFTVDEEGNVLELIRVTNEDGEMYYRDNGGWVVMNAEDDYPTIYDQKLIDVGQEDITEATTVWDESQIQGKDLMESDITPFAALSQ